MRNSLLQKTFFFQNLDFSLRTRPPYEELSRFFLYIVQTLSSSSAPELQCVRLILTCQR